MRHAVPIVDPLLNDVVLGLVFVFDGAAWWMSLIQFNAAKGSMGYDEAFRSSKDPPSFMVLFENTADLIGIALAALGTYAASTLHLAVLDGVASEASPLSRANGVLTVQLAPDQVLAGLSLQFPAELKVGQVEQSVIDIERRIRAIHPEVKTPFIKPQTLAAWKEAVQLRFGAKG